MRYRALESVYAATIKYVGTTFALIAADHDPELKESAWNAIFDSSSLGGWLDAVETVCKRYKALPVRFKSYCDYFTHHKEHHSKDTLDQICHNLQFIVERLRTIGYQLESPRRLNLRDALRLSVTFRNKCAHGALDSHFFESIEKYYHRSLRLILQLIPFYEFVFWGRHGSSSIEFIESPPRYRPHSRDSHFWVESDLLSSGFSQDIPFFVYKKDTRVIFCLNDKVAVDNPLTEYVDYASGQVVSSEVRRPGESRGFRPLRSTRPRDYSKHLSALRRKFRWREIKLTKAVVDACQRAIGVYIFTSLVRLDEKTIEVVLYVGQTTDLKERLEAYYKIKKGYNDMRPELTYMFQVYGETVSIHFCSLPSSALAKVEKAIYEVTMPEFNIISPPSQ